MNLQGYIERMKMWIDKQHFIMRHYKFALGIFFIITVTFLGIGIFYPHEEENVHISLDQSNGRDANQIERGSEKLSKETTHDNRNGKGKNSFKDESDIKNVKSILFNSQEAAYLVGLIAGKMTETNNVGFIGGMDIPVIDTFKYGYMAGVKKANSNVQIQDQFANSFTDQAKGKAIANQMYGQGADIIFIAGGDVGTGAIEAAKEKNKYAIGVDRDQSDLAPKNVLTSAIKRVDVGVYETVKDLLDGKFEGGTVTVYGLDQDAVGIAPTTKNLVPQDILDYVNQEIEKLKKGDIKVPKDKKEYDTMMK